MKKIFAFLALFVVSVLAFAGCSLVTKDNEKYLAEVVATVDGQEITREEYIKEYNSLYYNYYNAYSSYFEQITIDGEKLVDRLPTMALDNIINRKILVVEGKKLFNDLSADELNFVWNRVYDDFDSYMDMYAQNYVDGLKDDDDKKEDSASSTETSKIKFFEKLATAQKDGTIFVITSLTGDNLAEEIAKAKEENYIYSSDKTVDDYIAEYFAAYKFDANDDGDYDDQEDKDAALEAERKFVAQLRKSENGRSFDDNTKEAILKRKAEQELEDYTESLYVEKMQVHMESGLTITAQDIANKYAQLITKNYQKYILDDEGYKTDMSTAANVKNVFYFMQGEDYDTFYKLSHLLISFDDKIDSTDYGKYVKAYSADFTTLYALSLADSNPDNAQKLANLQNGFMLKLEDETIELIEEKYSQTISIATTIEYGIGDKKIVVENTKAITVSDFLILLQNELNSKTTIAEKYQTFAQFMNLYGGDSTGIMDESKTNNVYTYYDESSYVQEFEDAVNQMIDANSPLATISDLKVGYRSDAAYGLHIIMWLGECENLFDDVEEYSNAENVDAIIDYLNNNYYNHMSGQTLFDYVYNICYTELKNNNETKYINNTRQNMQIVVNEDVKNRTFE